MKWMMILYEMVVEFDWVEEDRIDMEELENIGY